MKSLSNWWNGLSKFWKWGVIILAISGIVGVTYEFFFKLKLNDNEVEILLDRTLKGSYSKTVGDYGTGYDYEVKISKEGNDYTYIIKRRHWDKYSGKDETTEYTGNMAKKLVEIEKTIAGSTYKNIIWFCETGPMANQFGFIKGNTGFSPVQAQLVNSAGESFAIISMY